MILAAFWLLYIAAVFLPIRWAVYLLFVGLAFGSFNTLPGGMTIVPYAACAPLLVVKVFSSAGSVQSLWDAALNWKRLGLLTAFVLISLVTTLFGPMLFRGVEIIGLNTCTLTPLSFGSGNITQPIYLLTSYFLTLSVYSLMLEDWGRALIAQGIILGGIMLVIAGFTDLATAGTSLLAPIRTASYALLSDADIDGVKRVVGFNTEASAYGGSTLSFAAILLFVRPASRIGLRWARLELPLAAILLIFSALSTSSGTYLGLVGLLILATSDIAFKIIAPDSLEERRHAATGLIGLLALVAFAILFALARPDILQTIWHLFDTMVLQKQSSQSYEERSSWNRVSLQALGATGGFGVGVGSTRASSWPVAVVSCTGILGGFLMAAFIARCVFTTTATSGDDKIRQMARGARFAFLVCAIPAAGAGTTVDFGFANSILFAIMSVAPLVASPPSWRRKSLGIGLNAHNVARRAVGGF